MAENPEPCGAHSGLDAAELTLLRALALWFALLAAALLAPPPSFAQASLSANVQAQLVSTRAVISPGAHFTVALRQNIRPGWHTYWRNPGDSGKATEIAWRLPPGFAAGPIQWPAPQAIPFEMLTNYGYSGDVLLPVEIVASARLPLGAPATLSADASWLACSNVCIPESATLSLTLPVAAQARDDATWAPRIGAVVAQLPRRDPSATAHISAGASPVLSIARQGAMGHPYFFAYDQNATQHSVNQAVSVGPAGIALTLTPGAGAQLGRATLDGVLSYEIGRAHV